MKITVTKPDGSVTKQSVDVPTAAATIRALCNAERQLRDQLIVDGVDADTANEIAVAATTAGRAAAHAAGLVPGCAQDTTRNEHQTDTRRHRPARAGAVSRPLCASAVGDTA